MVLAEWAIDEFEHDDSAAGRGGPLKAPFPWFGGKSQAADAVWSALGDPDHYVEPFAGSLAVLLNRTTDHHRAYYSETVNDADGLLVNAWRAIQIHPEATAEHAAYPVSEADLHARHLALVNWRAERNLELLMGTPDWCDPRMAGWWLWGICSWIGSGWCSGVGPWVRGDDGRIERRPKTGRGVWRQLPHVSNDGRGVNRAALREPLPGVGVSRELPHVSNDGIGVNRPQLREPLPGVAPGGPLATEPLTAWFRALSDRLRWVRILNGDWQRCVTAGVLKTLSARKGGSCGVFLDPPYGDAADRDMSLYTHDGGDIAPAVHAWALAHGDDPSYRIVVAGFAGEDDGAFAAAGWRSVEWFKGGFLRGGMGQQSSGGHQQARERLWLSPHCLTAEPEATERQLDLFAVGD